MDQSTCYAICKKGGDSKKMFICNKKTSFTTTNGTLCCGYHKTALFFKKVVFNEFECAICQDMCHDEEEQYVTYCNHSFHTNCINNWRQQSLKQLSCPLCRREIFSMEQTFE